MRNSCVTNDHWHVPFVVKTSWYFPHPWLITEVVTKVTRRVSLVEQELNTLPQNLSSSPVVSGVRVTRSLVFCVVFCRSFFFPFIFYLLSIMLVVLLRLADSNYLSGIFKLFWVFVLFLFFLDFLYNISIFFITYWYIPPLLILKKYTN